jgi:hypothetical protein
MKMKRISFLIKMALFICLATKTNFCIAQLYSYDKSEKTPLPAAPKVALTPPQTIQQANYLARLAKKFVPFPVHDKAEAAAFYDNEEELVFVDDEKGIFKLEHAYLNYLSQSKKLAVYSEVAYDYIGPVRLSLGLLGLVPSAKDSGFSTKKSDSIYNKKLFQDRFKSAGGVAQLNVSFPLLHAHDKKYFDLKVYASPRFAIDAPKEDTNVQRFAHHTQLGSEVQLKINTFDKVFSFLLCWRGFQAWGNSTFYDNMGFEGKNRKSFNFNTWTIGFIAKDKVQFYYTWYSGHSRAVNQISKENNNSLTVNYQF